MCWSTTYLLVISGCKCKEVDVFKPQYQLQSVKLINNFAFKLNLDLNPGGCCVSGPSVGGSVAAVLQRLCSGAFNLLRCRGAAGGSGPRRPALHPQQCPQPPALCQVNKTHSHLLSVASSCLKASS